MLYLILRDRRGWPHRKWTVAPVLRRTRYPCSHSSRCSSTPPYASPSSCQQTCSAGGARQSSHTAVSTPFHAAVIWFVSASKHTSHRNCPATSAALCGICRRALGHTGVNPGHNLFNLSSGQEGAIERHLAKAADTTYEGTHEMRFPPWYTGLDGAIS